LIEIPGNVVQSKAFGIEGEKSYLITRTM
jgi:hypothetical protein